MRDAPCAGRRVQLVLCVRKFFCRNPLCERKIFTERLPELVGPWAKMTIRYCQQLTSVGLATCGKGGTRLAARLGMQTSRQTILRHIMALPDPPVGSILYLGRDDFAFRRGYRFGTILVNLEARRVVDLLPDREAETSAAWMRQQLDLMVVSRDRGGEYASVQMEAELCRFRKEVLPQKAPFCSKDGSPPAQIGRRVLPRFRKRKENLAVLWIRVRRSSRS